MQSVNDNEHDGTLETFRPYALPDATWLNEAAQSLPDTQDTACN